MRCFIHIVTDTQLIRDREGEDFADRQAAAQEAAQVARDLMAEKLRQGMPPPVRWKVLLSLADDTVLMSLPFSELIPARSPPAPRHPIGQHDAVENRRLADADRRVLHARARVEAQKVRLAEMQGRGYDTSLAEEFLSILVITLNNFISHRDSKNASIARLARGQGYR